MNTLTPEQINFLENISGSGSEQRIINPLLKWALKEHYATAGGGRRDFAGHLIVHTSITEAGLDALDKELENAD